MVAQHVVYIVFFFALGACVGSFLNVVVWRLPRGESLVTPPSRCPKCETPLSWRDNIPVFGWIFLGGKCRYCAQPISARYPTIEAICGGMFVLYYVLFFMLQMGPCPPVTPAYPRGLAIQQDWPLFGLYLFTLSALLASSLIDAELYIIPPEIPWLFGIVGLAVHAIVDSPLMPGALNLGAGTAAMAFGGSIGLLMSIVLWYVKVLPTSFPAGEPLLEVDRDIVAKEIAEAKARGEDPPPLPPPYTTGQIRMEMGKEVAFLLPPSVLACVAMVMYMHVPAFREWWTAVTLHHWVTGLLGACLGAMVGAMVVWFWRIAGTLFFGRVAMGLGDVHLMFGVGAVIGAGAVTVAFFLAPFAGILIAIYFLMTGTRREMPFGPYLSIGTAAVMVLYCPIANYFTPGLTAIRGMLFGQ